MPVISALAFRIQHLYNDLLRLMQNQEEAHLFEEQAASTDQDRVVDNTVFVIQELLRLTVSLDSGDEIGRRRLFALVSKYRRLAAL